MQVYFRRLRYLRPRRGRVLLGLVCLILLTPASLLHPQIWKFIVDEVVTQRHVHLLTPALIVMRASGPMQRHGDGPATAEGATIISSSRGASSTQRVGLLGPKLSLRLVHRIVSAARVSAVNRMSPSRLGVHSAGGAPAPELRSFG